MRFSFFWFLHEFVFRTVTYEKSRRILLLNLFYYLSSLAIKIYFFPPFLPQGQIIINRPGLARAVIETGSSFINSFIHSLTDPLVQISSIHCQSQTERARYLKFWENVYPILGVMYHVSHVTCQESPVTCHLSHVKIFFCLI